MGKIRDIRQILEVEPGDQWGPMAQAALDKLIKPPGPVQPPVSGGVVDARSEKNIKTLHPKVQLLAWQLITQGLLSNMTFVVTSGSRTFEEQAELRRKYEAGGPKAARPGYSNHNFGLAFDVTEFRSGQPVWESPNYRKIGAIGKSLGLFWGGDWTGGDSDEPHFEFRPEWAKHLNETNMIAELRRRTSVGQDLLV